ncbi:protein of unknown function [Methylococcus capsulatus]|uniref:Uncharacterized protein n=1 Tax=Methylococcus capsulatus TaxID=414 RepID=A0AA35UXH0_METCP|nr:protein of unknown function [Methylococcus capsulatus]
MILLPLSPTHGIAKSQETDTLYLLPSPHQSEGRGRSIEDNPPFRRGMPESRSRWATPVPSLVPCIVT